METPVQARSLTAIALQGIGTRVRFQLLLWPVVRLLLLACLGSWLRCFCWGWDPAKVSWPTQSLWPRGGGRGWIFDSLVGLLLGNTLCCSVGQSCLTVCDPMDCSTLVHGLQASPSFIISRSLLKLLSIESVMPSNHLVLCCPLLLLPSIFPSIRVFANELALRIRWPKYQRFSFNIGPSNEYSGLIPFRIVWFDPSAVHVTLRGLLQHHTLLWLLTKGDRAWEEGWLMTAALRSLQWGPCTLLGAHQWPCLPSCAGKARDSGSPAHPRGPGGLGQTGTFMDQVAPGVTWVDMRSVVDQPSRCMSSTVQVRGVCGCFPTPQTHDPLEQSHWS